MTGVQTCALPICFPVTIIDAFSWGVSDRGASIRVPQTTEQNNWKGYVEDRRPASNGNPYQIMKVISETVNLVDMNFKMVSV